MDIPATEEQIRDLAFLIWEEAGSAEGRSDEFWLHASRNLGISKAWIFRKTSTLRTQMTIKFEEHAEAYEPVSIR